MKTSLFSLVALASLATYGQNISAQTIDQVTENALKAFNVPGIAIAVIKDGTLVHAKGYGVQSIKTKEKVTSSTLLVLLLIRRPLQQPLWQF